MRGRNVYPADLEDHVRGCHPSVRPGGVAAFSVESEADQGEEVVVYLELAKGKGAIAKDQMGEICKAARLAVRTIIKSNVCRRMKHCASPLVRNIRYVMR